MATRSRKRPPKAPAKRHKPADDRWELFCTEYVKDHNISQSAIRAGFPRAGAGVQGHRLLKAVKVINRVAELEAKVMERNSLEVDKLVQEAKKIAFADLGQLVEKVGNSIQLKPLDQIDTSILSQLTIETTFDKEGNPTQRLVVKPHSKMVAIQTLMKHLGVLKEHVELTGKAGGPVEVSNNEAIQKAVADLLP